jgi:hypothetical protein
MNKSELLALAERVESLDGPCFDTECEIEHTISPHWTGEGAPSAYTASLDAAMTLVPDRIGVGWGVSHGAGGPIAEVWEFNLDDPDCPELYHVFGGCCATPEQALTAAALRARAEVQP